MQCEGIFLLKNAMGVLCFIYNKVYALVNFSKPEMAPLLCKARKRKANILMKNTYGIPINDQNKTSPLPP